MNKLMHNSLYELLKAHQYKLVTAESCTGGLLAAAITSLPGSSLWFDRGFVTYSNLSKQQQLLVKPQTLEHYGAVSEQTAREMAEGALNQSTAHISLSITGIAGPEGGSPDKPVGTVWFGWGSRGIFETIAKVHYFKGDRAEIRQQATDFALLTLYEYLLAVLE